MSWDYELSATTLKNLRDLGPSDKAKVIDYLDKRIKGGGDPRASGKQLKGDLRHLWRYRVDDIRILARIEDHRLIVAVVKVGNHRDVYE